MFMAQYHMMVKSILHKAERTEVGLFDKLTSLCR